MITTKENEVLALYSLMELYLGIKINVHKIINDNNLMTKFKDDMAKENGVQIYDFANYFHKDIWNQIKNTRPGEIAMKLHGFEFTKITESCYRYLRKLKISGENEIDYVTNNFYTEITNSSFHDNTFYACYKDFSPKFVLRRFTFDTSHIDNISQLTSFIHFCQNIFRQEKSKFMFRFYNEPEKVVVYVLRFAKLEITRSERQTNQFLTSIINVFDLRESENYK